MPKVSRLEVALNLAGGVKRLNQADAPLAKGFKKRFPKFEGDRAAGDVVRP